MCRYGFVGVGTMSSAVVTGLCTLPRRPTIVLSPRNAQKSAALAERFASSVTVASSNQDVLDRSDVVFLGVLPEQADVTLRSLAFSPRHTVVSFLATTPLSELTEAIRAPEVQLVRAIPLPAVAKHRGATLMTPPHPAVTKVFDALGSVVPVADEDMFARMLPVMSLMGHFYAQQRATQAWLVSRGVGADSAAAWTGAVFESIASDSADADAGTFDRLVAEQTPGGLNEQVVRELADSCGALSEALNGVAARLMPLLGTRNGSGGAAPRRPASLSPRRTHSGP